MFGSTFLQTELQVQGFLLAFNLQVHSLVAAGDVQWGKLIQVDVGCCAQPVAYCFFNQGPVFSFFIYQSGGCRDISGRGNTKSLGATLSLGIDFRTNMEIHCQI
jgi:hypothetical protein